jgi:hypothetical protein
MQKAGEDACFAIFARHNRCLRVLESLIHDLLLPQDQATQSEKVPKHTTFFYIFPY